MSDPINMLGKLPPGTIPSEVISGGIADSAENAAKTSEKTVKEVLPLLRGKNVTPTKPVNNKSGGVGAPAPDAPVLDDVDETLVKSADSMLSLLGDLEKILAESMSESNEKQIQLAKERIKVLKDQIQKTKAERLGKVDKTMKEIAKAAKQRALMKALGWLLTIFTCIFAIAACVFTGGAAVGPLVAAGVALTFQVLNETGVMDKLTEALTEALKKAGCSKQLAQILAQVIMLVAQIAITVATGKLGDLAVKLARSFMSSATVVARAVNETVKAWAETIKNVCEFGLKAGGLAMVGIGIYTGVRQYQSAKESAKLKELESFLARLQQGMDEVNEEMQKLVEQLQSIVAETLQLVVNPVETASEVTHNFV